VRGRCARHQSLRSWPRLRLRRETRVTRARQPEAAADSTTASGGALPGSMPLDARWSKILSTTSGRVMTARIRILAPQRAQTRGSTSCTSLTNRAQARLLAWRSAGEADEVRSADGLVLSAFARAKCAKRCRARLRVSNSNRWIRQTYNRWRERSWPCTSPGASSSPSSSKPLPESLRSRQPLRLSSTRKAADGQHATTSTTLDRVPKR